ncbi:DUF7556 family protein [Halegenticoccus soli]|uniref:DUF7556 family protein n=1 Tax=Halegenticoccus soli TaxID=1985678 RepID=UPI000C6D9EB3|nr:hypothetical protein [Halegenticoccus soli]
MKREYPANPSPPRVTDGYRRSDIDGSADSRVTAAIDDTEDGELLVLAGETRDGAWIATAIEAGCALDEWR